MDHAKSLGRLLLAGALAAAPLPAAAGDIFLRLEGIKGESVDARRQGEIELLSYTQSFPAPSARGTTGGAAKATCGPVTIMKYVDVSSPDLILFAASGRHIPRAVITFRRPGQTPVEYYRVTLENVMVTAIEQSDSRLNFPNPAPPRAVEKVTLIGQRFRVDYLALRPDGKSGAQPKAGWDCAANQKL